MQRILVTGGAGFIGKHVVASLLKSDFRVVVIDNTTDPKYKSLYSSGDFAFYREDIRNRDSVREIVRKEQIDTCIHLAAIVSVTKSILDPIDTTDNNVNGTLSVLESCSKNNVTNFVFASSAAVYGEPTTLPLYEEHTLKPLSPYGASKVAGEAFVMAYKNCGKLHNTISLRFFNVYGKGQNPEYAGVITKFTDRLAKGLPPVIHGDGNQTRDFIFIEDVVKSITIAANAKVSGVFNIGTGIETSINNLAEMMIKIFGLNDIQPLKEKPKSGEILRSYANVQTSRNLLGFEARHDLDAGLRRFLRSTASSSKSD
jgi:UDP-glucose 4-epimerase